MMKGICALTYLCFRKVQYNNKEEAKKAAFRMTKKTGSRHNHFKCRICGKHHIGMANKWGR